MKNNFEVSLELLANLFATKKSLINNMALKPKKVPARRLINIISDDTTKSVLIAKILFVLNKNPSNADAQILEIEIKATARAEKWRNTAS